MSDPCTFQDTIMKLNETSARHDQLLTTMAPNIANIAINVELLTAKLSKINWLVAGFVACGSIMYAMVSWIIKAIPVVAR